MKSLRAFGPCELAIVLSLGACAPTLQTQLDSKIGEQRDDMERVRGQAAAEAPTGSGEPSSRGDDEDPGEATGAAAQASPWVTYPGFKLLPSGRSRVFVEVTGKAEVTEDEAERQLTLHLRGVGVPEKVNRLPLVTTHFDTAVQKVRVIPMGDGVDVVIELKAKTQHWTKLKPSRVGSRLTVDFAKPLVKRDDSLKASTGFKQEAPEKLTTNDDPPKGKSKGRTKTSAPSAPAAAPTAPPAPPKEAPKEPAKEGGAPKLETSAPL